MNAYKYMNSYADYNSGIEALFLKDGFLNNETISRVEATESRLMKSLEEVVPALKLDKDADYSLYTGYCGIAYLFFIKYLKSNDEHFKDRAIHLVDKGIANLKGKRISFLTGDSGPLALAAVLHRNEPQHSDRLIDRLVHLNFASSSHPNEVLYGRAGYLYSLLFVDKFYNPVIPYQVYRKVIVAILFSGRKEAKKVNANTPLYFTWHEKNYLGAAHGLAGILYVLLSVHDKLEADEKNLLIKPTLDHLSEQRYSTGNYISSEGSTRDRLVQWCHGAPGFVHLFLQAYKVYGDDKYLELALNAGDVVWERGILEKGYSICHGVSGNGYVFLALYNETKDVKHLYRAACFADWCTSHPTNEGMKPHRPFSLFEGISGIACFLNDVLDPLNASFPAYEI